MQLLLGLTLLGPLLLCITAIFQLKNTMLEDIANNLKVMIGRFRV